MAVGSQAIEVGCVVPLESGHIELPVSDEFVKNKTAVAMGGRWFFWVNFRTVIGTQVLFAMLIILLPISRPF
jgi:hypothetical protein